MFGLLKGCPTKILRLANHLFEIVEQCLEKKEDVSGVCNLAYGTYVTLWNEVLHLEKSGNIDCVVCLQLRHMACKLLVLTKDVAISMIVDRVRATHDKFDKGMAAQISKHKNMAKHDDLLMDLYVEITTTVRSQQAVLLGHTDWVDFVTNYLYLHNKYGKLMLSKGQVSECMALVEDVRKVIQSPSGARCQSTTFAKLTLDLLEMAAYIKQVVSSSNGKVSTQQVLTKLQKCNSSLEVLHTTTVPPIDMLHVLNSTGQTCIRQLDSDNNSPKTNPILLLPRDLQDGVASLLCNITAMMEIDEKLLATKKDLIKNSYEYNFLKKMYIEDWAIRTTVITYYKTRIETRGMYSLCKIPN